MGTALGTGTGLCFSGTVPVWTPRNVGGALFGYRSDKLVTTVGAGLVTALGDWSGAGLNLAKWDDATRPTLDSSGALPKIVFTRASSTMLFTASMPAIGTADYSILLVQKFNSDPAGNIYGVFNFGNGGTGVQVDARTIGTKKWLYNHAGVGNDANAAAGLTLNSILWRTTGGQLKTRINGVDLADRALAAQTAPVAGYIFLGSLYGNNYSDMDFYEWWCWPSALADPVADQLSAYTVARYGV